MKNTNSLNYSFESTGPGRFFYFSTQPCCTMSLDGSFKMVNPAWEKILGWSIEEILTTSFRNLVHPEDIEKTKQIKQMLKRGEAITNFENRCLVKNGGYRWFLWNAFYDGIEKLIYAHANDITERKEAELALKAAQTELEASEKNLRLIIDKSPALISCVDHEERYRLVNLAFKDFFHVRFDEIIGKKPEEFVGKEWYSIVEPYLKRAMAGEEVNFDYWHYHQGRKVYFQVSYLPLKQAGETCGALLFAQDVTEREEEKEKLKVIEQNFNLFMKHTPAAVAMVDENMNYLMCSDRWLSDFKIKEDITGRSHYEAFPELSKKSLPAYKKALEGEVQESKEETEITLSDGSVQCFKEGVTPWYKNNKEVGGLIFLTENITNQKHYEAGLKEHEEKLKLFVKHTPAAIAMLDIEMNYLMCSDRWISVFKLEKDLIGKSHYDVFPYVPERWRENNARVLKGESLVSYENIFKHQDGTIEWVHWELHPWYKSTGTIGGIIIFAEFITERKISEAKLRAQREKLRLFIKHTPVAVAMFDTEMNYLMCSEKWMSEFKVKEGIIGKSYYEVFPQASKRYIESYKKCLSGKSIHMEEDLFKHLDGSTDYVRWELQPWYELEGLIGGVIIFAEIITERKIAEKKIERIIEELSSTNADLERFAYVCSHDLKEPLRTISSFAQLIEHQTKDRLDDTAREYLKHIINGADRMKNLIHDVLRYSQAGVQGTQIEKVNMNEVVSYVKEILARAFEETGGILEVKDLPKRVYANHTLMVQVFQNLISNALKFKGKKPSHVIIGAQLRGKYYEFYVKDNGIGIAPEYHEKVFGIFERLHTKNTYTGTGVGLALCKKIVEQLGGKIWVDSKPKMGSTFYFTLPKDLQKNLPTRPAPSNLLL